MFGFTWLIVFSCFFDTSNIYGCCFVLTVFVYSKIVIMLDKVGRLAVYCRVNREAIPITFTFLDILDKFYAAAAPPRKATFLHDFIYLTRLLKLLDCTFFIWDNSLQLKFSNYTVGI
jgi:hypothetical protein